MESYQETVLSAMKLSFFLIGSEIGEIPAGAQYLIYTVSSLESLPITEQIGGVLSSWEEEVAGWLSWR